MVKEPQLCNKSMQEESNHKKGDYEMGHNKYPYRLIHLINFSKRKKREKSKEGVVAANIRVKIG